MDCKKYSLIVMSCDKYLDAVDVLKQSIMKYWKDCPEERYLVLDSASCEDSFFVEVFSPGKNISWSDRLKYAVNNIKTDYFILLLDDFFLRDFVKEEDIENAFSFMEKNKSIGYIRLNGDPSNNLFYENETIFSEFSATKPYRISTHPGLWNKQYFLALIGDFHFSAWDFEREGSTRSEKLSNTVYEHKNECVPLIGPAGAITKSCWIPEFYTYMKKNDFKVTSERQYLSFFVGFKLKLRSFIYNLSPSLILKIQHFLYAKKQKK